MAKKKIAVLGGGMGALTTVWELTRAADWQERFDITVYQNGWRLGGKGASGRNGEQHDRIEEHGLHVMFGFYENVFRVMRECYAELGRPAGAPLATWQEAFKPHDLIVMMEKVADQWLPWPVYAPRNDRVPGERPDLPSVWDFVVMAINFLVGEIDRWLAQLVAHAPLVIVTTVARDLADRVWLRVEQLVGRPVDDAARAAATSAHVAAQLASALPANVQGPADHAALLALLDHFSTWLGSIEASVQGALATDWRRLSMIVDFTVAVLRGIFADGLVERHDWFKIDDLDFRAWLKKHGASDATTQSPIVRGLYDAVFATDSPLGAGTIVHLLLRMGFTYAGSVLYKMQAGMGDTIFAPLYAVLRRRGVAFRFFHQVNEIRFASENGGDGGDTVVSEIAIGRQATLKVAEYDPIVDVKGLPSWPSSPLYEQLVQGDELKRRSVDLENWWSDWADVESLTLTRGRDFDEVVLGISVAALASLCPTLVARSPRFSVMVDAVATCQTQAFQLWLTPDLAATGWPPPTPIVIPYVEPYDTWADMSQLIDKESWPPTLPVGSIAYLCSQLVDDEPPPPRADHGYPARQVARAKANALAFLQTSTGGLWPRITQPDGTLDWSALADASGAVGPTRFDSQYWHAPVSLSERYVLSVPGSSQKRLKSDDTGCSNLVLAGDHVLTSLSAGCLEAATMSGLAAARALLRKVQIVGRDELSGWI